MSINSILQIEQGEENEIVINKEEVIPLSRFQVSPCKNDTLLIHNSNKNSLRNHISVHIPDYYLKC